MLLYICTQKGRKGTEASWRVVSQFLKSQAQVAGSLCSGLNVSFRSGADTIGGQTARFCMISRRRKSWRALKNLVCRAPLYAVVSMEPDDEVANHVDIPERLLGKRRGGSSSSSFQGSLDDGSDHNGSERCGTRFCVLLESCRMGPCRIVIYFVACSQGEGQKGLSSVIDARIVMWSEIDSSKPEAIR